MNSGFSSSDYDTIKHLSVLFPCPWMYMYHNLHSGPKQLINNRKIAIVITSPSNFLFKITLFNTQPGFSVKGQNSDRYLLKYSTVSALSYFIITCHNWETQNFLNIFSESIKIQLKSHVYLIPLLVAFSNINGAILIKLFLLFYLVLNNSSSKLPLTSSIDSTALLEAYPWTQYHTA